MLNWKVLLFIARMLIWTPVIGWAAYAVIKYWSQIPLDVVVAVLSVCSVIYGMFLHDEAKQLKKLFPNERH